MRIMTVAERITADRNTHSTPHIIWFIYDQRSFVDVSVYPVLFSSCSTHDHTLSCFSLSGLVWSGPVRSQRCPGARPCRCRSVTSGALRCSSSRWFCRVITPASPLRLQSSSGGTSRTAAIAAATPSASPTRWRSTALSSAPPFTWTAGTAGGRCASWPRDRGRPSPSPSTTRAGTFPSSTVSRSDLSLQLRQKSVFTHRHVLHQFLSSVERRCS